MSQEYAKSYDQLLDSEVRLGAVDCSVGSDWTREPRDN